MIRKKIDINLENRCRSLEEELKACKKELEIQTWGLNKTNEAVKSLYKELEKKNQELKALDQLKSDFLRTVSHELRTPLTTTKESVSQVLDGLHGEISQEQRDFLSICLDDIDRLWRVVDNLLDVSTIEAGKFKINKQEVDIVSLARRVMVTFEPALSVKNLSFKENILCDKAMAYADKDSIIRVFTNLIANAIKFTDSGYIEIGVLEKDDFIECYCLDTGKGIKEEDLPLVFGKFQQFHRVYGPGSKGTGLGLNISKGIIELNRGKIWIESELDKGTKLSFSLPKYNAKELYKEHVSQPLIESIEKRKNFSVLVFEVKDCADDLVLLKFESLVRGGLRNDDLAIRFGEVIIVLMPGICKAKAQEIAQRIYQNTERKILKEKLDYPWIFNYEAISYPEDGLTQELIEGGKFIKCLKKF